MATWYWDLGLMIAFSVMLYAAVSNMITACEFMFSEIHLHLYTLFFWKIPNLPGCSQKTAQPRDFLRCEAYTRRCCSRIDSRQSNN